MTKKVLLYGFILGVFIFISSAFQTLGLKQTTAGKNAFLTATYVVIVPFLAFIFFKKKLSFYNIIAIVLAIVGLGLITLNGSFTISSGDGLSLIGSLGYALHILFLSRVSKKCDIYLLTVLQFVFVALLSWIIAPVFEGPFPTYGFNQGSVLGVLYLGIISSALGYLLQSIGQKYVPESTTAIILSTESVFGALSGIIFLQETMSVQAIIGCVIMFLAVTISETKLAFIPFIKKRQKVSKIDNIESENCLPSTDNIDENSKAPLSIGDDNKTLE